jgi:hypothetical protein
MRSLPKFSIPPDGSQVGLGAIEVSVAEEPEEDDDAADEEGGEDPVDEEAQAALDELDGAEEHCEKKAFAGGG